MSSAFEVGIKENFDHFESQIFGYESCGQCEDVGVVVLSCECDECFVPTEGRADALVCGDGHIDAVAAATDGDTEVASAVFDRFGERVCIAGIVATIGTVCAVVVNAGVACSEPCCDFLFEFVTGMVGCDADRELM